MSTKCQYHAAASNPKWRDLEKWNFTCRTKHTNRNVVPISTCSPWNPVATKNVDPYTASAIVNGASMYSYACKVVKYTPKIIVKNSPWAACEWLLSISL